MKEVKLTISQLELDLLNPRLGRPSPVAQIEALDQMLSLQKERLLRLASDIVDKGLAPGLDWYVIEDAEHPSIYTVLDGNRRLSALRLLDNPEYDSQLNYFSTTPGKALLKRFQALRQEFDADQIEPIRCTVFLTRDEAETWLQRRHAGELGGVGQTMWSSVERNRAHNPNSPLVSIADFMRTEGLSDEEEEVVNGQWTTIGRFVESPTLRAHMGLEIRENRLISRVEPEVLAKLVRAIIQGISTMGAPSRQLDKVSDREEFLFALPEGILPSDDQKKYSLPVGDLRKRYEALKPQEKVGGASKASQPGGGTGGKGDSTGSSDADDKPGDSGPKKRPPQRRRALFKKSEIPVQEHRAQLIYTELCRLKHEDFPTSATVLFRMFLEASTIDFCESRKLSTTMKGDRRLELHKLIAKTYDQLKKEDSDLSLPQVERLIKAGDQKSYTSALNGVVHDRWSFASSADAINIAETFRSFLIRIWEVY